MGFFLLLAHRGASTEHVRPETSSLDGFRPPARAILFRGSDSVSFSYLVMNLFPIKERNYMRDPLFYVLVSSLFMFTATHAQEQSGGKFGGYVMGDYFYKVRGDSTGAGSQYSSVKKDEQAFQFRRIYLGYDHTISEKFAAQVLLEANDKVFTEGRHGVFVKTAYLEWKEIIPFGSFFIGLVPTPTWSLVTEKLWNYRSIEKTIIDFRGLGVASDIGIQLRGGFDQGGIVNYVVMVGNGNGQRPENNKYKKYYGSLHVKPVRQLIVEAYADFEPLGGDRDILTLRGFAAFQSDQLTAGVEVIQQRQRRLGVAGADRIPFGVSVFAWGPIPGTTGFTLFGRFDYSDPDTKVKGAGYNEMFVTAGLDYMPVKDVHFMPNIWINAFSRKSSALRSRPADVVARLTFFYLYR